MSSLTANVATHLEFVRRVQYRHCFLQGPSWPANVLKTQSFLQGPLVPPLQEISAYLPPGTAPRPLSSAGVGPVWPLPCEFLQSHSKPGCPVVIKIDDRVGKTLRLKLEANSRRKKKQKPKTIRREYKLISQGRNQFLTPSCLGATAEGFMPFMG